MAATHLVALAARSNMSLDLVIASVKMFVSTPQTTSDRHGRLKNTRSHIRSHIKRFLSCHVQTGTISPSRSIPLLHSTLTPEELFLVALIKQVAYIRRLPPNYHEKASLSPPNFIRKMASIEKSPRSDDARATSAPGHLIACEHSSGKVSGWELIERDLNADFGTPEQF
ncbi:hypothetical protein EVAR_10599_1 [Eumeta japonica]|uniref:Uncharacterized protein n=1 Tax=Eumeta variegata TaxID=151549 RepID=A0A4C1U1V4_EUMVA|nr:hypothetical protein EVAR_10599_1 [Eumeta japonica]